MVVFGGEGWVAGLVFVGWDCGGERGAGCMGFGGLGWAV